MTMKVHKNAFTLIELLIVMGMFSILAMISSINLIKPQVGVNIDSVVALLVSDIKIQQMKAMSGSSDGSVSAQNYGVYIEPNKYTLFVGSTYNSSDPKNFVVNIDHGVTISNSLTSSQVVFAKETGEIVSYNPGSNIVVTHASGTNKTINISSLGVVEIL